MEPCDDNNSSSSDNNDNNNDNVHGAGICRDCSEVRLVEPREWFALYGRPRFCETCAITVAGLQEPVDVTRSSFDDAHGHAHRNTFNRCNRVREDIVIIRNLLVV